jgi:hypothetical protein
VKIYDALLGNGENVTLPLVSGRKSWVQVVRGTVDVNSNAASAGDGVAIEDEDSLTLTAGAAGSELLVFDLP